MKNIPQNRPIVINTTACKSVKINRHQTVYYDITRSNVVHISSRLCKWDIELFLF